jgi:hypothetical protein
MATCKHFKVRKPKISKFCKGFALDLTTHYSLLTISPYALWKFNGA